MVTDLPNLEKNAMMVIKSMVMAVIMTVRSVLMRIAMAIVSRSMTVMMVVELSIL